MVDTGPDELCFHDDYERGCTSCVRRRRLELVFQYSEHVVEASLTTINKDKHYLHIVCSSNNIHKLPYKQKVRANRNTPNQYDCECKVKLRNVRRRKAINKRLTINSQGTSCLHTVSTFNQCCSVCREQKFMPFVLAYSTDVVRAWLTPAKRYNLNINTVCKKGETHTRRFVNALNKKIKDPHEYDCNCLVNYRLERSKATCLERYGVPFPAQNDEVRHKARRTAFEYKKYKWPDSGKVTYYQGYENYLYDVLRESHDESEILVEDKLRGIPYINAKGNPAVYFGDARIADRIYECKSLYTANSDLNLTQKLEGCVAAGLEAHLYVFQGKKLIYRVIYLLNGEISFYHHETRKIPEKNEEMET